MPIINLCSVDELDLGTTPESCWHMTAVAMAAWKANQKVQIYVDNAPTTNCADIPAWFHADVRYFSVFKP